jgi:serine/threonine protein kinase
MEGIARALAYLHPDCSLLVIHQNISCNNVLLDSTIQVCASNFNIAKFLNVHTKSNWIKVSGSFRYMAPKLGYTMKTTEKCDV